MVGGCQVFSLLPPAQNFIILHSADLWPRLLPMKSSMWHLNRILKTRICLRVEPVSVDEYTRMNTDDKYRRRMILNHPQITVKFFELRTRQYIAAVLQPALGIRDYFFRFEFAEGRGQVFCTFVGFFFVSHPLSTSLFPPSFSLSSLFSLSLPLSL